MSCETTELGVTEAADVIGAHIRRTVELGDLLMEGTGRSMAKSLMTDARRLPGETIDAYGLTVKCTAVGNVTITVHGEDCTCEAAQPVVPMKGMERNIPVGTGGGYNHRAYLGVWCTTCGARPGEWCRRVGGPDIPLLRSLHVARLRRLAALDRQGWK